ncbi:hypothetical protein [Phenylobacterium sp.]|jgi:hypothetical protein|uniref:hypothetical protein n=1 Tax=Phenylobacterium sp. TaxID=1871053 RepID=UPI002F42B3DD
MAGDEDEQEWISAPEAADLVHPQYGNRGLAEQAIIVEAAGARISTRRARLEVETLHDDEPPIVEGPDRLDELFWRIFNSEASLRVREDWTVGTFILQREVALGTQVIRAFGVEFYERDIRSVFRLPERSFAVFPEGALQASSRQVSKAPPPIVPLEGRSAPATKRGDSIGDLLQGTLEGREIVSRLAADAAPPALIADHIPNRTGERKTTPKPFVPDDRLTAWYEKRAAQFPAEVHRQVKVAAEKRFHNFRVGKNQLYDVMRAIRGKLKAGNPTFSRQ